MAERARAKAKPKAAKGKKPDVPAGATGSRGKVAKTKSAKIGDNSGKVDPALVAMHNEKLNEIEIREKKARDKLNQIVGERRAAYAVVKQDGIAVDDFKLARELDKRDHGEVITGYANVGEYLAAIKSPLSTQMDLFANIQIPLPANATLAGTQAYKSGLDRDTNPFKPGTDEFVNYDEAWLAAQNATAQEMSEASVN
jgi:hypothetical protein